MSKDATVGSSGKSEHCPKGAKKAKRPTEHGDDYGQKNSYLGVS